MIILHLETSTHVCSVAVSEDENLIFNRQNDEGRNHATLLSVFIEEAFKDEPKVRVITYSGLTIDLCKKENAEFILRGLRNPADFEFEKAIAHTNRVMSKIETVFLLTAARTSFISSSIVRDVLRNGGDITQLVPESVLTKK